MLKFFYTTLYNQQNWKSKNDMKMYNNILQSCLKLKEKSIEKLFFIFEILEKFLYFLYLSNVVFIFLNKKLVKFSEKENIDKKSIIKDNIFILYYKLQ